MCDTMTINEFINEFFDDDDPLKKQLVYEENITEQVLNDTTTPEVQDPTYIRCQIFDEIPERVSTIQCEGYIDKNGNPLDDETSIKHLTSGENKLCVDDIIECYDENGNFLDYVDFDDDSPCYYIDRDKYDLRKITKQIRMKKFICEAPIGSGKSTVIRKWISSHKTDKFIVIVPTVNIAEEFYTKLIDMKVKSIQLCVNDNAFKEFHKAVHNEVNIIITTYNTAVHNEVSKSLGDLIGEYYEREQRLDYFLVIDEAHLLLQHISLIEITKEFDKVALISATAEDIKHFACFRDYMIVNPCIDEKYNRNIYINKLIPDVDEQRAEIVNLIDIKRMKYDIVL